MTALLEENVTKSMKANVLTLFMDGRPRTGRKSLKFRPFDTIKKSGRRHPQGLTANHGTALLRPPKRQRIKL